jgi:hypothetical protein
MDFDLEWEEAWDYQPGFTVELKSEPGALHTIESYDPMMVPPVWLADDPMPRYPHELKVISHNTEYACPMAVPVKRSMPQLYPVVA